MTSIGRAPDGRALAAREREIARIQRLLERLHSPRLQMIIMVGLTGAAGFLASFVLLQAGLGTLWLRYGLAVGIAYLVFLFLLWYWLRLRRDDVLDVLDVPAVDLPSGHRGGAGPMGEPPFKAGGGRFGGAGGSGSFGNGGDAPLGSLEAATTPAGVSPRIADLDGTPDWEDAAVVLVALAVAVAAVSATLWAVWAAPTFLAELMLDAALATGLYRRMRHVEGDHWLRTALRRTAKPFSAVAVLFMVAGAVMQLYAPGATSIGQVIERFTQAVTVIRPLR